MDQSNRFKVVYTSNNLQQYRSHAFLFSVEVQTPLKQFTCQKEF